MLLPLLLLWSMVAAQQPSPSSANDLGVVKGKVIDPDGKPVQDAQVYVEGAPVWIEGKNSPPIYSRINETTTNVNGDFVLDQVIPSK